MIWTILTAVILLVIIMQLSERIKNLEEVRGGGFSRSFSINVLDALIRHPLFGEITGIESAQKGRLYSAWTQEEKDLLRDDWGKIIEGPCRINFTYLPGENGFLIKTGEKMNYASLDGDSRDCIYLSSILEHKKKDDEFSLDLRIYWRYLNGMKVLTVCLAPSFGVFSDRSDAEKQHQVLLDFPYTLPDLNDEVCQIFEFEAERSGGGDVYKDNFGEHKSVPTHVTLKKNGATVSYLL